MNTYAKFCANVFVAKCEEEHEKGETIIVTTKFGKENECEVHNLVAARNGFYYYSITRVDGFDAKERLRRKAEKYSQAAINGKTYNILPLAHPRQIGALGAHSEKWYRFHQEWENNQR